MLFCFPSRFSIPAVRLFNKPKLLELPKPLLGIARVQMNLHRDLPQAMRLLEQHEHRIVAVPRRGASCYGKNAKNTMRIFGIPTIFLYYLLYFCVSIRDIVGFLWCEPACNNLIYCYYNTRFAPNQPASKPSSFATGCKTQRHKL